MKKKIAFIGITGNLSQFVYPEFLKAGHSIRALVRNPNNVKLDSRVEVVKADLKDLESLKQGLAGMDVVYMNISTTNPEADFQPEVDGISNLVIAAKTARIQRIYHVSAITMMHPEFTKGKTIQINEFRKKGIATIRNSGIPYSFFHMSWVYETLEFTMRKDNKVNGFKPLNFPFYWISARDLGRMATRAISLDIKENRDYIMQGEKPYTFEEVIQSYTKRKGLKPAIAPAWIMKVLGLFSKQMKMFAEFADFFKDYEEKFVAGETHRELGKPRYGLENFN